MGIDLIGSMIGVGVNSLQNISGISWQSETRERSRQQVDKAGAADSFSQILARLQGTGVSDSDSTESTTTLTKALPDGTLVIQKLRGAEVVSETKVMSSGLQQAQQELYSLMGKNGQMMQAYIAGMGIAAAPAGAVFNASTT